LLPLTASVNAAPPAVTLDGASEADRRQAGLALLMSNTCTTRRAPRPGAGLLTVTVAVPAVATSEAGTAAVSCVSLTKVVLNAWPFQSTADEATKLLPLTVQREGRPAGRNRRRRQGANCRSRIDREDRSRSVRRRGSRGSATAAPQQESGRSNAYRRSVVASFLPRVRERHRSVMHHAGARRLATPSQANTGDPFEVWLQ
jgi:hypothetical protein